MPLGFPPSSGEAYDYRRMLKSLIVQGLAVSVHGVSFRVTRERMRAINSMKAARVHPRTLRLY
jgi:hypothetical protein